MDGMITGETGEVVGLSVIDNNEVEHLIEMDFTGTITGHQQDGYADDPDERSSAGIKHVQQARNYARYYVYRERGYDTLDRHRNPDRLLVTALVVGSLSTGTFEAYFGDLYQQIQSHYTDREPVVEVDDALEADAFMLYAEDIYLGLDDAEFAELIRNMSGEALEGYLNDLGALLADEETGTAGIVDHLDGLAADHGLDSLSAVVDPADWIEAVSGIHVQWRVGTAIHRDEHDAPAIDRGFDARLEIVPYDAESLADFQDYVVHHLKCQIRDRFVDMGVTPPPVFQVQGPGADVDTLTQQTYDAFQDYYDPEAEIDWENV